MQSISGEQILLVQFVEQTNGTHGKTDHPCTAIRLHSKWIPVLLLYL